MDLFDLWWVVCDFCLGFYVFCEDIWRNIILILIEFLLILLYCLFIVGCWGKIFIIILDSIWLKKKNYCKYILIVKFMNFVLMIKIIWFRNLKYVRFLLFFLLMNYILFFVLLFFWYIFLRWNFCLKLNYFDSLF